MIGTGAIKRVDEVSLKDNSIKRRNVEGIY